ncbi:MAG: bifunctional transaldolase/phosoglucose isomerase [Chloroflexi bacterium]|nr:bifunctional transaldolase/phosoglucose isomerase [Chloroflexota bacterium]
MNPIQRAHQLGQAIWLDTIRRAMLKSGELKQLVDLGVSGLTANPTIMEKAIIGSIDYDDALLTLLPTNKSAKEIYETLAIEDIQAAADLMRPIHASSRGEHGYPCLEISPLLAHDTEGSVREARGIVSALARPNVMPKVPATPEGIPAIRRLTAEGINVNVTLIFSLDMYRQVMEAYISGLEELVRNGGDIARVTSVASFFLSRIDTLVDLQLEERIRQGQGGTKGLLGKAAVASAKLAYQAFKETFYGQRFAALRTRGARVQRPLWASTGTKNPAYSDLMYVEPLIGPDTVNTMTLATIHAFLDHGRAALTLEEGVEVAKQTLDDLKSAGINMAEITAKLLEDGVKSFSDSFEKLISGIDEKKAKLQAQERLAHEAHLGKHSGAVEETMTRLKQEDTVGRIWRRDHTVWKPDPTEITDRLGWLTVGDIMSEQGPALTSFAQAVRKEGSRHVVLLGMGGSSLGAEVLRQVFGSAPGYPDLIVLDSILPEAVRAVSETIDPGSTLFLVSSKSGTTTEPLVLYQHFRAVLEATVSQERTGNHFVAITDPGTPLAALAGKEKFRHVFLNPADIGGRYSVLSYFGLVPAALLGIDIAAFLDRADRMKEGCAACVPAPDNGGAWLGAHLGSLAQRGKDKLTLFTSPGVSSFGLWCEQLIAESTGKEGKGIIPVAGEPLGEASDYGDDRMFVYLRLKDDDNAQVDSLVERLKAAGQPVVVLKMNDRYDLGAEFYRWEFATAVASALLGVHPFDQPDVQRTKSATERLLSEYAASGRLPEGLSTTSLGDLLGRASRGAYLAVMAYLRQTTDTDEALADLRREVVKRYHIATTLGYGPRFLHSTGQLHKGGPDIGLFLQITSDHDPDLAIPGKPYTFGLAADAQARGDLEALKAAGRPVAQVRLRRGDSLHKLVAEVAASRSPK